MHWTSTRQRYPDAVENITIWIDTNVEVRSENAVEGSNLLVSEEGIWHPNFAGVSQGQVANSLCHNTMESVLVSKPLVVPLLSHGDLEAVFHLDIINFREAPNKYVDVDKGSCICAIDPSWTNS